MEIKIIEQEFSICKINDINQVNFEDEFCFVGKTDEELSLVCTTDSVPGNTVEREDNWRGFRIQGVLDFSLIGILSKISTLLADNHISIFAVSTFNTDYIFVKSGSFEKALSILKAGGYQIV